MTDRDRRLIALGAGPSLAVVVLMIVSVLSGAASPGELRVAAFAGILTATIFPAFAHLMRVRGSR
jgi:hypothetical protein